MAAAKKASAKKPSAAELKRRKITGAPGKKKPSPLAKKKISNAEAATLLKKQAKAKRVQRQTKEHMKGNKPGRQNNRGA